VKWLIRWSHGASNDVDRLDADVVDQVMDALDRFAIEGTGDVRRLTGIDPPEYRLRVGKWRIRFQIDLVERTIYVLHVLLRDEAY
jgi:mRNA-degrading endonuclease RelE of RelBE toxin-antitoxin system